MKNKKIIQIGATVVSTVMLFGIASVASAQTSTTTSKHSKFNQSSLVQKSDTAIDQRIQDLTNLETKIAAMKNLNQSEISSLSGSVQSEVSNLTNLKTKIAADTDMTSLKADAKSITTDNRVYALLVPQTKILAASDKATTIINMLNAMVPKLQSRIADAQTAGKDVTTLNAAMSDFTAKISDATSLSGSIASGITGLTPDQGNQTIMASNTTALKTARNNLSLIQADLVAARKDIKTIVAGVKGVGQAATAETTNTTVAPTTDTTATPASTTTQ